MQSNSLYTDNGVNADTIRLRATTTTSSTSFIARVTSGIDAGLLRIQSSRRELKDDILDIEDGLNIIKQLRPRQFHWLPDPNNDSVVDHYTRRELWTYGFIVQEVEELKKDLICYIDGVDITNKPDEPYPIMWKQTDVIALLTKSVQELSAKVDQLQERINVLENK